MRRRDGRPALTDDDLGSSVDVKGPVLSSVFVGEGRRERNHGRMRDDSARLRDGGVQPQALFDDLTMEERRQR